MKKIGTFRPPIGCGEQTTSTDSGRSARVWLRMTELFGKRWTDTHGTTPPLSWVRKIDQLTDEKIRIGLNAIMDSGVKHPPGLPEFVVFCESHNAECRPNAGMYKQLPSSPPETKEHREARLERGRQRVGEIKAKLRGKS